MNVLQCSVLGACLCPDIDGMLTTREYLPWKRQPELRCMEIRSALDMVILWYGERDRIIWQSVGYLGFVLTRHAGLKFGGKPMGCDREGHGCE